MAESGQSPRGCILETKVHVANWTLAMVNGTHVRSTNQSPGKEEKQCLARSQAPH